MRIFKRDSEPVVVRKIAEQAIRDYDKRNGRRVGASDPTKYYSTGNGSFGSGGGGTGLEDMIWFNAYGIGSVPSTPTYIQRSKLNAVAGVHLYDASNASAMEIRLNLINDPLYCLVV